MEPQRHHSWIRTMSRRDGHLRNSEKLLLIQSGDLGSGSGYVPTTRGCLGSMLRGAELLTSENALPFTPLARCYRHQEVESRRYTTWLCISTLLSPPLRKGIDNPDLKVCQGDHRYGYIVSMFHFCLNPVNVFGIARKFR